VKDHAARFRPADQETPLDLAQITADDDLVESLRRAPLFADVGVTTAGAAEPTSALPADARATDLSVEQLLQAWRYEINAEPLPPPIDTDVAVAILRRAPARRRTFRPIVAVATAITALLIGSAAIGARSATPESPLWGLTQLLWGDRADSVIAGQSARDGLDAAHAALQAGHPDAAATALVKVTEVVTKVAERDGRQTLEQEIQSVRAEIEVATQTNPLSGPATSVISPVTTTQLPTGTIPPSSTVEPAPTTTSPSSPTSTTSEPVEPTSSEPEPPESTDPETPTTEPSDPTTTTDTPTTGIVPTTDVPGESEAPPEAGDGGSDDIPATSAQMVEQP
jgi:hypothetical protein